MNIYIIDLNQTKQWNSIGMTPPPAEAGSFLQQKENWGIS